jgi:hypothetical protein
MTLSRRLVIRASALAAGATLVGQATASSPSMDLLCLPLRVFKTADFNLDRTESWAVNLFVQTHDSVALTPKRLQVDLLKNGRLAKSTVYIDDGFGALTFSPGSVTPKLPDGSAPTEPLFWPFIIRLRHSEPLAAGIDAMRISVVALDPQGHRREAAVTIPVETYTQRTALIYPFRGKGIILQAGVANGGHRNRSGQFALDGFGLNDTYGVMDRPGEGNTPQEYTAWGRTLLAPADGVIAHARNDRPDQPDANTSDPRYYAPEFPNGGDVGNHVVIDHGDNEFSMIAHFQSGSVLVREGDRVRQGDPIGKLGASGDATGPHVHYQLQTGRDWQYADALPCTFTNVHQQFLVRGTYFEAV